MPDRPIPDRLIPNVVAAVDVVLFTVRATARVDDAWQVLLVQRGDAAFGGHWSLPGVLLRSEETFDEAARRALRSKAGLDARDWYLEQLATIPGLAILLVAIGFNLLGDGLRDALDPRMKR